MNDLKEAYCSYCNVVLRAHHNDLVDHSKTAKHVSKKNSLNIKKQPTLNSFGTEIIIITIYHLYLRG